MISIFRESHPPSSEAIIKSYENADFVLPIHAPVRDGDEFVLLGIPKNLKDTMKAIQCSARASIRGGVTNRLSFEFRSAVKGISYREQKNGKDIYHDFCPERAIGSISLARVADKQINLSFLDQHGVVIIEQPDVLTQRMLPLTCATIVNIVLRNKIESGTLPHASELT